MLLVNRTTIDIPFLQLPPREIYFPRSFITVNCTRSQAHTILDRFKPLLDRAHQSFIDFIGDSKPSRLISEQLIQGFKVCQSEFQSSQKAKESDWIVLACIPGYDYTNQKRVATLCRLISVEDNVSSVSIKCFAFARGLIKHQDDQTAELTLTLQSKTPSIERSPLKIPEVIQLCHKVISFIKLYAAADTRSKLGRSKLSGSSSDNLEQFLLLSPLANVLYAQLTKDPNIVETFKSVSENFSKQSNVKAELDNVDCFMTIFPFTAEQKCSILFAFDEYSRLEKFNLLVEFGKAVFEDVGRLQFVADNWQSLSSSKYLKSDIITRHLRNLKFLVDDFGRKSGATPRLIEGPAGARKQTPRRMLNEDADEDDDKLAQFIENIDNYNIAADGKKMILKDYKRLQKLSPSNGDYHTLLSYLEVIQDIPWNESSAVDVEVDLNLARAQLDKDHYGLDNVKERIVEYLAILNLHKKLNKSSQSSSNLVSKAPILLLTGPPGVGKTSLAKSVATTLNRKFQRISLGGLKDESEIKGHRRTYVGALPGLIIQALRKAQSNNPVILLDEIDKVCGGNVSGNKVNGDPLSLLLEVLDPEQNANFTDHYIGFPVDLSNVIFLCTSNDHYQLSAPLLDRMELLEISGYNYLEKVQIAKNFILPRQILRSGLPLGSVILSDELILKICTDYTRESGVRNLERTIAAICRGKAIEYSKLLNSKESDLSSLPSNYIPTVSQDQIALYIGIPPHIKDELNVELELSSRAGVVNGLSYNSDGSGSKLIFEMIAVPSSSFLIRMTGRLGEVLRESCEIAVSLVKTILNGSRLNKSNAELLAVLNSNEFHLHVPLGSISKDGPSAGITMTMCLISLVLNRLVPSNIAMTGEITLRGLVLPIGGVMEKLLGAHLTRKVDKVLLPRLNRKDIIELYLKTNKSQTEQILKEETDLLHRGAKKIYGSPEKYIEDIFGIKIVYVEDLNDALVLCFGENEVHLVKNSSFEQLHL